MVLNNVTKFHKILIKSIRLREPTSFQMVNFHKQRVITTESMVRYGPLSNLKKTSWYLIVTKFHKILSVCEQSNCKVQIYRNEIRLQNVIYSR